MVITRLDVYTHSVRMGGIKCTGLEEQREGEGDGGREGEWSGSVFDFRLDTASGMISVCIYACVCICAHV